MLAVKGHSTAGGKSGRGKGIEEGGGGGGARLGLGRRESPEGLQRSSSRYGAGLGEKVISIYGRQS